MGNTGSVNWRDGNKTALIFLSSPLFIFSIYYLKQRLFTNVPNSLILENDTSKTKAPSTRNKPNSFGLMIEQLETGGIQERISILDNKILPLTYKEAGINLLLNNERILSTLVISFIDNFPPLNKNEEIKEKIIDGNLCGWIIANLLANQAAEDKIGPMRVNGSLILPSLVNFCNKFLYYISQNNIILSSYSDYCGAPSTFSFVLQILLNLSQKGFIFYLCMHEIQNFNTQNRKKFQSAD